jgi:hypothetical protein
MRVSATRTSAVGRTPRLLAALAATAATVVMLAMLPTAAPAQASSTPTISTLPIGQVESVLGQTPLSTLGDPTQVAEVLSQLEGLQNIEPGKLQQALTKLVEGLTGEGATLETLLGSEASSLLKEKLDAVLGPLAAHLEELLGGNPLTKLTEALNSAGPTEVIGQLLSGSSDPQELISQILSSLNPQTLEGLLGSSLLSEAPFSPETVEGLAGKVGTTSEALAADLGKSAEALPATAMALTAPLTNGETLGVLNGLGGVTLGLIKGAGGAVGGSGGTGGSGAPGGSPGATVTVGSSPSGSSAATTATTGKLKVLSHSVKGANATIVVEVPSAGKLSAGGKGVRSISRETAKAERVTLHPALTRADTSSLRRHRHRELKVPVKVSFKQTGGPSSTASVPLLFH